MDENKILKCQKYYIFKIRDIVNNSFHTLEEKRTKCLIQYLELSINTYDEYRKALDPSKLKRAYEGLIEGLDFQIQHHPFRKLDLYKNDFTHLHKLIALSESERNKELHNIYCAMVCLKKKLCAADIIGDYILCLEREEVFGEMDILIEALISDLLYKGYSLAYLIEWFKNQQTLFMKNGQDVSIIHNLTELDRQPIGHTIYIKFVIRSDTQLYPALQLLQKQFIIEKKEDFSFGNMWRGVQGCIRDDQQYGWVENNRLNLIMVKKTDNVKMLGYVDSYYKSQMNRFLKLKDDLVNEDIKVLERVLYTLNTAKTYKIQNRFLNFWSALEYTLYPFPRYTIIEKARVVVPEVFSLFYIKNKLNIFWARLTHYLEPRETDSELNEVIQFVRECKDLNDGGYDTQKVIKVFQDEERIGKIIKGLEKHVVLERETAELQMLITNPYKAIIAIKKYYEAIMHDLNYIYRLRNQLIHSTKGLDDSLEHISMRLYRYVNSVLSTMLYYKEKNGEYTITDILNSIDATYLDYVSTWGDGNGKKKSVNQKVELSLQEAYKIVRPPYLFIE